MLRHERYDEKVDVWSFGCLLELLWTHRPVYSAHHALHDVDLIIEEVQAGTLRVGDSVKVLGESYSLDDQEDSAVKLVSRLWVYNARYRIEVSEVPAGCWALIEGVEGSLVKTGTITEAGERSEEELRGVLRREDERERERAAAGGQQVGQHRHEHQ